MRVGLVRRMAALGDSAQASVPGLYAWAVTVVPPAWARGASPLAKAAAVVALLTLGAGVAADRRWGGARAWAFWGFVGASAVSWLAARSGAGSNRFDAPGGVAGMLGWALFAFASAAPPLARDPSPASDLASRPAADRPPRHARGDVAYLAFGAIAATAMNLFGWRVPNEERALLIRCVALATGLAIIGASAQITLARYAPRVAVAAGRQMRRAILSLTVLAVLALVGLLLQVVD